MRLQTLVVILAVAPALRPEAGATFGDGDGDGRPELVFWNQRGHALLLARVPANPKEEGEWPMTPIFTYTFHGEMQQRATAPPFKSVNEHEGLALADINGDGRLDLFCAEMRLNGGNPESKIYLLLGDGRGNFRWLNLGPAR